MPDLGVLERRAAWSAVRNVLAVRLDAMGDVLMTTPAFRAIRESVPDARLTLLTSPGAVDVAACIPELDAVIAHDVPWMKATAPRTDPGPDLAFIERLREARFDAAIVFTVHSQDPLPAALTCWLAGIPLRLAHCRDNPYQLLTDWVRDPEALEPQRHEVRRQLDLVATVGYTTEDVHLSLRVPPDASRRVRSMVAALGLGFGAGERWAVLHPGATAASRRYPPDRFAAAARTLAVEDGWRFLVTGSPGEAAVADEVVRGIGGAATSLAGRLSFGELAALIAIAPVLITNNTGPAHMAAAVGTPVVDVYALTNLQHAPWAVRHRLVVHDVPCRGCRKSVCPLGHNACLTSIEPDEVVAATRELVGGTRTPADDAVLAAL
ncbi:MAG TPA: glycosyltransferase family 9 protein [Candidatus Limnocylindrales bacterium]|nr:glycosyltransferase family 9 protein [Candidatus Limnocylindrales bacterium]